MCYSSPMPEQTGSIALSVVAPAHNEQDNIRPLVGEIAAALDGLELAYEIIIVDDGSTDRTREVLVDLLGAFPRLRVIGMTRTPPGRGNGQSAAFHAGFREARGDLIAVLDADLQNDPADIPAMLRKMQETGADLVQGDRSANRRDTFVRRISSGVGRFFRRRLLGDTIRDTGCSLRIMRRVVALELPLKYRGMHRFIPVTARQLGYTVIEMPVNHRPRVSGEPKYGIWNRAFCGIPDCLAVRWMRNRRRPVAYERIEPTPAIETARREGPASREAAMARSEP
ncbi:MAG: glycosyltransferase family 2 protein [Planctomycetota bacterium]|nr:glycosyltransferase family 2 protein [Planctomycetota bacterium]